MYYGQINLSASDSETNTQCKYYSIYINILYKVTQIAHDGHVQNKL